MREVTPKKLQKLNSKSFKKIQKIFCRRLREIAANGSKQADFDKGHFSHEDEIITWLRSLGFKVTAGTYKYYITWPEEEDIIERLRNETFKILTQPKPATVTHVEKLSKIEFGWNYDTTRYDFVCSCCNEHSEYTSNYCPHCGAKTYVPNGGKRRDY